MLQEFRDFTAAGNALDPAISGAFGAIVGSRVNDVLMPVISPGREETLLGERRDLLKAGQS